jgi:geranyl-CoA carboxylase beta subunit
VESAGANLLEYEVEMWMMGGGIFARLARLSAAGLPVVTVLHGASAAGGAYMPGMSDYVVGVKDNGKAYLAGPALLKAATGEVADDAELGGSAMHARISGLVEYLAEDDAHGLSICRDVVAQLDWNGNGRARAPGTSTSPCYDPEELLGIVPVGLPAALRRPRGRGAPRGWFRVPGVQARLRSDAAVPAGGGARNARGCRL